MESDSSTLVRPVFAPQAQLRHADFEGDAAHALAIALEAQARIADHVLTALKFTDEKIIVGAAQLAHRSVELQAGVEAFADSAVKRSQKEIDDFAYAARQRILHEVTVHLQEGEAKFALRLAQLSHEMLAKAADEIRIETISAVRTAFKSEDERIAAMMKHYQVAGARYEKHAAKSFWKRLYEAFVPPDYAVNVAARRNDAPTDRRDTARGEEKR